MRFVLIDQVLEESPERIVVVKQVSLAEEYLADHFPGFPVLPGVLMIETMVQAARRLLAARGAVPMVLGHAKALKFGAMVRPGEALEVEVTIGETGPDGSVACRGTGRVRRRTAAGPAGADDPAAIAASGRFTMRPPRRSPRRPG